MSGRGRWAPALVVLLALLWVALPSTALQPDGVPSEAKEKVKELRQDAETATSDPPEPRHAFTEARALAARALEKAPADDVLGVADELRRQADDQVQEIQGDLDGLLADDAAQDEEETPDQEYTPASVSGAQLPVTAAVVLFAAGAAAAGAAAFIWLSGSGGFAGATAARGLPGYARRDDEPRTLTLFTRPDERRILDHPNRQHLYGLVRERPGVRLQDLCKASDLSRTAATHHLRILERNHLVVSRRVGRGRHYYENGGRFERDQKDAYAVLQNERSRHIARFIADHPGTIQKSLCEAMDLRASIAHWHVKRLQEASLVEAVRRGRTVAYYPADGLAGIHL